MQPARELDPAAVRELDVDQRDLRLGVREEVDRGRDVARRADDVMAGLREQDLEPAAHGLVVVDDDELGHSGEA